MNENLSLKNITESDAIVSMYNGKSSETRLLGDGLYIVAAYFPQTDIEVMYTEDGIPNWSCAGDKEQTAFLEKDMDDIKLSDFDFSALSARDMVNEDDLKNYKDANALDNIEIRTCLGMWRDASSAPTRYIEEALQKKELHLFRKRPS
ncbi:MAG: hypothetical protein U9Q66_03580 [Patescibacteria group bacterium]|nr:hypothetical protein [Patescibacteria group bacterium]